MALFTQFCILRCAAGSYSFPHFLQDTSAIPDLSILIPSLQHLFAFGWDEETETKAHELPPVLPGLSPTKRYIPPGLRKLSSAPSSDSEASDAENGISVSGIKSSRVRFLALSCLQLLIKSNPKALHPWWPSLLPEIDTNLVS